MNYEINSAIEQLQKSLEKVDSAREQVETVTASYAELESAVRGFTDNLANISANIVTLISNMQSERSKAVGELEVSLKALQQISNDLVTRFSSSCESISKKFNEQTASCVEEAKKEVANLHLEVAKLEGVHETISTAIKEIGTLNKGVQDVLNELKTSQTAQDLVLDKITKDIASALSKADKIEQVTNAAKSSLENSINGSESKLNSEIQRIETSITQQITSSESGINGAINNSESKITQALHQTQETISQQLNAKIEEVKKLQSQNRILVVVAIIMALVSVVTNFIG